jgi:CheY-like chemotaxis protein
MSHGSSPRVLVIEDDANIREIVIGLLGSFGYDCQTAVDGWSGLARIDEGGWDLVLTDLPMPDVDGWGIVEAIRKRVPTVPVVLFTGLTTPAVLRRAHEYRVQVIIKPFHVQTLKAAVVEALYAKPCDSALPPFSDLLTGP